MPERVIYLRYDIPFGDDIRLRRMNGTDIITSNASNKVLPAGQVLISCGKAVYHIAQRYIIDRKPNESGENRNGRKR